MGTTEILVSPAAREPGQEASLTGGREPFQGLLFTRTCGFSALGQGATLPWRFLLEMAVVGVGSTESLSQQLNVVGPRVAAVLGLRVRTGAIVAVPAERAGWRCAASRPQSKEGWKTHRGFSQNRSWQHTAR